MSCNKNCDSSACGFAGIVLSVVFGAIVAILFAFGLIPFIGLVVWILFGLGVLILINLIIGVFLGAVTAPNALSKCLIKKAVCLLAGTIGTIISAIILLSVVLSPLSIFVIIFIAILVFFFSLMINALIDFISCIVSKIS